MPQPPLQNPQTLYKQPPFERQPQDFPGSSARMTPEPDHGEHSYRGSGRLEGRRALITGADSGIGRAVAIAFAREGADVALSFMREESEDADAVAEWVRKAGRRALLLPGDIADPAHCRDLVARTAAEFGGLDLLVNNAAFQHTRPSLEEIPDEEWDRTFRVNIDAIFHITKAAVKLMPPGSSIVCTSSVNAKHPMPTLIPYSATKAAIANMTISLAQSLAPKGIRVNAVLPGPIWTPFIVTGMSPDSQESFGSNTPYGRAGQPAELASAYVVLASNESSYTSGALVTVAGGMPIY